uniref:RING-type E3 ubiquitin transferase n=2 Tax=Chenopodium quinoa TaxID=63459 RepID=A0A803M6J6_CHEQI
MNWDGDQHDATKRITYELNSKIMVTAILSLCFVILLVTLLHIYARCVLRHPRRNPTLTFIHPDLVQLSDSPTAKSGLDPTAISLLPSTLFKQMENDDEHIECSVCLSILEEDQQVRRLPNCNHVFHTSCIDQWLSGQATCPICRSEVSPQLTLLDREPPIVSDLTEVVVVTSEGLEHNIQDVISSGNNSNNPSKIINAGSGSSSSSFRMSSFRKIISRERSLSSSRMQVFEEIDPQNQVQQ